MYTMDNCAVETHIGNCAVEMCGTICMVPIGSPLGCSKYSLEMF